jgi:predicted  nucleic acid-binding Zn-ribbon protein
MSADQMRAMVEDVVRMADLAAEDARLLEEETAESRNQVRRIREELQRTTADRHTELRALHKHLQGLRGRIQQQLHEVRESRALAQAWEERAAAAQQRVFALEQELAEMRQRAEAALIRAWIIETRVSEDRLPPPQL